MSSRRYPNSGYSDRRPNFMKHHMSPSRSHYSPMRGASNGSPRHYKSYSSSHRYHHQSPSQPLRDSREKSRFDIFPTNSFQSGVERNHSVTSSR